MTKHYPANFAAAGAATALLCTWCGGMHFSTILTYDCHSYFLRETIMIGYVCLGTNNIERASKFYDALFAVIGAKRQMELERGVAWGMDMQSPLLAVLKPFDGAPASVGNGVMVAIVVDSLDKVDALYSQAIALHAQDEGLPGQRSPGFYAGYFRDLDGNKLCAFCMG